MEYKRVKQKKSIATKGEAEMKRPIEFNHVCAFSFTTKCVDADSIEELKVKVEPVKDSFMELIKKISPEYQGLKIVYYELEVDNFASEEMNDEVSKWLVEFSPLKEEKFEEVVVS